MKPLGISEDRTRSPLDLGLRGTRAVSAQRGANEGGGFEAPWHQRNAPDRLLVWACGVASTAALNAYATLIDTTRHCIHSSLYNNDNGPPRRRNQRFAGYSRIARRESRCRSCQKRECGTRLSCVGCAAELSELTAGIDIKPSDLSGEFRSAPCRIVYAVY